MSIDGLVISPDCDLLKHFLSRSCHYFTLKPQLCRDMINECVLNQPDFIIYVSIQAKYLHVITDIKVSLLAHVFP